MTTPPLADTPVLEIRNVYKHYGRVSALRDVTLAIQPGEVVGLVGDNGAGKSTLVKILSGALAPSSGEVFVGGSPVTFQSPLEARRAGIETVYQDLALALDLSIAQNMFLGREVRRPGILGLLGWLDRQQMESRARTELDRLRIRVDSVSTLCNSLSGGQRQAVAVARAVAWVRHVILMDEPTAALGVEEQEKVGELIEQVRDNNIPVLLVSHNMPQVHSLCDRVIVLYHGQVVAELRTSDISIEDIVMWITGAALAKSTESDPKEA